MSRTLTICLCRRRYYHILGTYPGFSHIPTRYSGESVCWNKAAVNLNNTMRLLWDQHAAWTRMAIYSIVEGTADAPFVVQRLLRSGSDLSDALEPYYGKALAQQLGGLIRDHLAIAADLVKAAKAGDTQSAAEIERKWYANADEIAALMQSMNPYWSEEEIKNMMHEHLKLVKDQVVLRIGKKYEQEIQVYDKNEKHLLKLADVFTKGIIRQFPRLFQPALK